MSNDSPVTTAGNAPAAQPDRPESAASVQIPGFFPPALIIERLSEVRSTQPVAALAAANQHRDTLTDVFLQAIERGINDPKGDFTEHGMLFNYASYFLAKWREPRACPLFLRWFSLPGELALELGGDTVTHHGARFLASVCSQDVEGLKQLIQSPSANPSCRGQALLALAILSAWGEQPLETTAAFFSHLAQQTLGAGDGLLWCDLTAACVGLELVSVFPQLRAACEQGWIPPSFCTPDQLDHLAKEAHGDYVRGFATKYPPIIDIAQETRWWAGFQQRPPGAAIAAGAAHRQPYVAPPRVGRNDPCPCGSGKKHKKCCGATK
ncbi:MAG: DUF1186 domain-containing protein [Verrucomicrobiota bacterium]